MNEGNGLATEELTPEEHVAYSINALWEALEAYEFTDDFKNIVIKAATPEFAKHYLKGQ